MIQVKESLKSGGQDFYSALPARTGSRLIVCTTSILSPGLPVGGYFQVNIISAKSDNSAPGTDWFQMRSCRFSECQRQFEIVSIATLNKDTQAIVKVPISICVYNTYFQNLGCILIY